MPNKQNRVETNESNACATILVPDINITCNPEALQVNTKIEVDKESIACILVAVEEESLHRLQKEQRTKLNDLRLKHNKVKAEIQLMVIEVFDRYAAPKVKVLESAFKNLAFPDVKVSYSVADFSYDCMLRDDVLPEQRIPTINGWITLNTTQQGYGRGSGSLVLELNCIEAPSSIIKRCNESIELQKSIKATEQYIVQLMQELNNIDRKERRARANIAITNLNRNEEGRQYLEDLFRNVGQLPVIPALACLLPKPEVEAR